MILFNRKGGYMKNLLNKTLVDLLLSADTPGQMYYRYKKELLRRLEKLGDLRCCGNCKYYRYAPKYCYYTTKDEIKRPHYFCHGWVYDGRTSKQRIKGGKK
jgi:hypothetical protein